ncbi:MAG: thioredoxin family protein [Legionella sp.]|nr:thioredoxin family protein [Legionella sp.]
MAKTPSSMLPLGTPAPGFSLTDVITNSAINLHQSDNQELATVICFICNHCPYVKHINLALTALANDYIPKNIRLIAINSNDTDNYPDDSPENMKLTAETEGYTFPYLFDETQEVAKAYHAACTPDFFVFDQELQLAYRGQLDDSRPGNGITPSGASIREALNCLIRGEAVSSTQKPSIGCNIKWKESQTV